MMKILYKKNTIILFIALQLIMLIATSIPGEEFPDNDIFKLDKLFHFFAFFAWGLSFQSMLISFKKYNHKTIKIITLTFGALYGIFDELHQIMIPGRSCSIDDFIADFMGLLFSLLFFKVLYKIFKYYE